MTRRGVMCIEHNVPSDGNGTMSALIRTGVGAPVETNAGGRKVPFDGWDRPGREDQSQLRQPAAAAHLAGAGHPGGDPRGAAAGGVDGGWSPSPAVYGPPNGTCSRIIRTCNRNTRMTSVSRVLYLNRTTPVERLAGRDHIGHRIELGEDVDRTMVSPRTRSTRCGIYLR
jgi:hypothetical protein